MKQLTRCDVGGVECGTPSQLQSHCQQKIYYYCVTGRIDTGIVTGENTDTHQTITQSPSGILEPCCHHVRNDVDVYIWMWVFFYPSSHTGHMAEYMKLHSLLIRKRWHGHRLVQRHRCCIWGKHKWASEQSQVCVAVKKRKGEGGRRSGTKASVTIDHTNGCLEAAIRPESCLCVGVGTSDSRLYGSKGAVGWIGN